MEKEEIVHLLNVTVLAVNQTAKLILDCADYVSGSTLLNLAEFSVDAGIETLTEVAIKLKGDKNGKI